MTACRWNREAADYLTPDGDPCPDVRPLVLSRFEMGPESDCWIWQGTLNSNGYGVLTRARERAA